MQDVKAVSGAIAPEVFRQVMGRFATGVCVVTYRASGGPAGMTANAFLSVSLDPPLVLVSIRKRARLLAHVGLGDLFGINVLSHDQDGISDHFGGRQAGPAPCAFREGPGAPVLAECLAAIVARVVDLHPAGDHQLMIGRVEALEDRQSSPLIFYGGRYWRMNTDGGPAERARP